MVLSRHIEAKKAMQMMVCIAFLFCDLNDLARF
jgi:hypothetical protein